MTAVSDSSSLILFARVSRLDLLESVFGEILVPPAVWHEVVVAGAERAGTSDVLNATWIRQQLQDPRIAEDVPLDVQLFLLPDDDPVFAATEIASAARAAARGDNVYLRHVRLADLPE